MWKSKKNRHYLCVTLHSVDENFISESQVLSFKKFHGRSFAKSIRTHLEQVINEFCLFGMIIETVRISNQLLRNVNYSVYAFIVQLMV
jgi:hypothetical protein